MDGFPSELVSVDVESGAARLELDEAVYPLEAVYGASYIFIDRCYVLIDRTAGADGRNSGRFRITLAPKQPMADLRPLVGEFANELLSCAWRHQITQNNRSVIEAITTQAIGGAMGPPSLDDLEKFDFSAESFEDPLGIAVSWEEKYKKK